VPLYEIVLRRRGVADEVRLTDHAGFSVGDSIRVGRYDCLVTSTSEVSENPMVVQRVVCTLAVGTPMAAQLQRERLLGEALEGFEAAAFVFDAHGRMAGANEAATRMTGYSRAELSELDLAQLVPDPASARGRVAAVVGGALRYGDSAIRRKDGTVVPIRFRVDTTTLAGEARFLALLWPIA
jgi:PAS domain S-box-containing protein